MSARDDHQARVLAGVTEPECWAALFDEIDQLRAEQAAFASDAIRDTATLLRYRAAILDIDAHATPMGVLREDDPDGSPEYYYLTVGALHRALALTGASAKCYDLPCPRSAWLMESATAMRAAIERLAGYVASGGDSEPSYTEFLAAVMHSAIGFDTVVRDWQVARPEAE